MPTYSATGGGGGGGSSEVWGFPRNAPPQVVSTTALGLTANEALYVRWIEGGTISKIGLKIGTSSGNIDIGTYSPGAGTGRAAAPDARDGSAGGVAMPAAGWVEISLGGSVAVEAGDFSAVVADNGSAVFTGWNVGGGVATSGLGEGWSYKQGTAYPLPATATPAAGHEGYGVLLIGEA